MDEHKSIGRKLCRLYPHLARELITVPDLTDTGLIKELYAEYRNLQVKPGCKSEEVHQGLIFTASILRLYDPDWFCFERNIRRGLRGHLEEAIGCDGTSISHNLKNVKNYMQIYSVFRNEVLYVYGQLKAYADGPKQKTSEIDGETEEVL